MVFEEMLRDEWEEGRKEGREEGIKEGIKEGREEGLEKGIEKGLEALVLSLKSIVDDFDKVYEQIRKNETYANVTPDDVRKYYK